MSRPRQSAGKPARVLLTLAALVWVVQAPTRLGGAEPDEFSNHFNRGITVADGDAKPLTDADPLNWWSIPGRARAALRELADSKNATITRCVFVEEEKQVTYEVHARRRLGLFRSEDFVLLQFSEPRLDTEARREARSLRGRLERFRQRLRPGASSILP